MPNARHQVGGGSLTIDSNDARAPSVMTCSPTSSISPSTEGKGDRAVVRFWFDGDESGEASGEIDGRVQDILADVGSGLLLNKRTMQYNDCLGFGFFHKVTFCGV